MAEYIHPESLVSTDWVAEHGNDANVRLVEVDVDTSAYEQGHISGAVGWNWQSQLQQTVRRDLASKEELSALLGPLRCPPPVSPLRMCQHSALGTETYIVDPVRWCCGCGMMECGFWGEG